MAVPRGLSSLVLLFLLYNFEATAAYRLNVPRVLLPYHPTIPVKFVLEVSQPTGGCFHWRSTRPDVVSVSPIGVRPGECSDRAEIRATAKAATGELTAVIFADDSSSGTTLSCGVSVDQIAEIKIETTTKVLFVDAAPVRIVLEAFNKEGDHFSTLSEVPIDWELVHSGGDRPLRIVPFEQSTYEAPVEIVSLEKQKKRGYVVLVEGVVTGSAMLTARFNDPFFAAISDHSLDLTVVANLLLIPAYDLYVPVHSTVPFQVLIVRQHSTEVVPMPSNSYYLHVDSSSICSLDKGTSSVYAESRGRTDIHLLSNNVDVKAKTGVRPPSTAIHVVDPETLQWSVFGENWILQTGKEYTLQVSLLDPHGNSMYIGDNLRFESVIPLDYFDVRTYSGNQTHYVVTPKKIGKTIVKSKFVAVINKHGKEDRVSGNVHGEQSIEIVDPVRIEPQTVILPYLPRSKNGYHLRAYGGSGLYDWSVDDGSVCGIDSASGVISAVSLGNTRVTAADRRNTAHFDVSQIAVVEIESLSFGKTAKEAEVGQKLVLNVQMFGAGHSGPVPFTDCRSIQWAVQSADTTIIEWMPDAEVGLPTIGTGCATITLRAKSSGDTKITVIADKLRSTIDVSVYLPIQVAFDDIALAIGSEMDVSFEGGARPWILDPSHHFRSFDGSDAAMVQIGENSAKFICRDKDASFAMRLKFGNKPSESLPLPLISEIDVSVCCARPTRFFVAALRDPRLSKCHSPAKILRSDGTTVLSLSGYGSCGKVDRLLDSISGLEVNWSTDNKSVLKIDAKDSSTNPTVFGHGKVGNAVVTAEVSTVRSIGKLPKSIKSSLDLRLVNNISAEPNNLVLWNEAVAKTNINVNGGSGQYFLANSRGVPYDTEVKGHQIVITPRSQGSGSVRIVDACLVDEEVDVTVKISDISTLIINGPKFVEVGSELEIVVAAADEAGNSFSQYYGVLAGSKLEISNNNIKVVRQDGERYILRGEVVGAVSLSASAKSSSGRVLTSRSHSVQVFSPISLHPKIVTLIPESTFQLEVLGGPQPTPPIHFAMNTTKVVSVEPNALITSQNVGYTSITGTVNVASGHVTKDTVVVRVVSLAGIRLVASTRRVERGGRIWLRLEGLDSDETPFSFGGALYPFKVTWTVSHPDVLRTVHPFGQFVTETFANRYAIWLDANAAGSAVVKVHVELSAQAKHHFVDSKRVYEDTMNLRVEEPLSLRRPELPLGVVRVAPATRLQLETAWPESSVEFFVPPQYLNRLSVTSGGLMTSHSHEGAAAVAVRRTDAADNETSLIPVVISSVYSLDVLSSTPLTPSSDLPIYHLPVGLVINLHVVFRDIKGRTLNAAANSIAYRPHRFDLTEIIASDENRTMSITLKSRGETVLKIWASASPSVFVFVRLSAEESLLPSRRSLLVSDIICFHSPLEGDAHWYSSDSAVHWVDAERGVARLMQSGFSHVTAKINGQSLHSDLSIGPSRQLTFADNVPAYVTNVDNERYVFPVGPEGNFSGKHECTDAQRDVLSRMSPPIDCSVSFTSTKLTPAVSLLRATAVYLPETGSYACIVQRHNAGSVPINVVDTPEAVLRLSVKWLSDMQQKEIYMDTKFHLSMDVLESELQLSDLDRLTTTLSVVVPSYQSRYVSVTGCDGDVVSVIESRNPDQKMANKFFEIKLNVKAAAVWNELSNKCTVTVHNSVTGQKIVVPVKVKLIGQAAKHIYNALDSNGFVDFVLICMQRFSWIIPSMMGACVVGLAGIAAFWWLKNRSQQKQGSYADESMIRTPSWVDDKRSPTPSFNSSRLTSFQGTPGMYRESPIFKSTGSPRVGDRGDADLWNNAGIKQRY